MTIKGAFIQHLVKDFIPDAGGLEDQIILFYLFVYVICIFELFILLLKYIFYMEAVTYYVICSRRGKGSQNFDRC